jgi:translation initiation factor 5
MESRLFFLMLKMSLELLLGLQPVSIDIQRMIAWLTLDPTKFFGCELGAQTTMADDRYIVNGAHTQERLLELLDSFIVKYVLCGACDNPETEFVFSGKGRNEVIHKDCKACGRQTNIDMRHKLTTYILKNPPPKKGKGGKGMTAQANAGGPMVYDAEDGDASPEATGDMGVPTTGTDIDAALGRMGDPILDQPDAVEELSKKLESTQVDDDDEEGGDSPYAVLGAWLEEHKDASDEEINAQISELGLTGKHKALLEIGEHLFTPENVGPEMEKRVSLLESVSLLISPAL